MKIKILLVLIISLFVISCGDDGANPYNPTTEIFPLAVGNSWTYQVYTWHKSDMVYHHPSDTMTIDVSSKVTVDGSEWYVLSTDGKATTIAQNRIDGFYAYRVADLTKVNGDTFAMRFIYPANIGDRVITDNSDMITQNTNVTINTAAGPFTCISYTTCDKPISSSYTLFLSPGVGFIRQEGVTMVTDWETPPDTIWLRMDLIKYTIKK